MSHRTPQDRGFTTIELLVVIGIIVLLISLLIPVVGKVRDSARATDTAAWVQQLGGAIEAYHADFRAYPGPLADKQILNPSPAPEDRVTFATGVSGFKDASGTAGPDHITMSENLLLGLLGGLKLVGTPPTVQVQYDPSLVGNGASSLNTGSPKRFSPYVEFQNTSFQVIGGVKTGEFFDEASMGANSANPTGAEDSNIPEFVDRYSDPLPILYYRAKVGANVIPPYNKVNNPVITYDPNNPLRRIGPYDVVQNAAYTRAMPAIGVGRKQITYYVDGGVQNAPQFLHGLTDVNLNHTIGPVGGPGYTYPYTGFPYFRDPSLSNPKVGGSDGAGHQSPHVPRQKDRFILIAAGPDRIYGTTDDITNFGPVVP